MRRLVNRTNITLPPCGFLNAVDTCVAGRAVFLTRIVTPAPDAVPGPDWGRRIQRKECEYKPCVPVSRQCGKVVPILALPQYIIPH